MLLHIYFQKCIFKQNGQLIEQLQLKLDPANTVNVTVIVLTLKYLLNKHAAFVPKTVTVYIRCP